jgi:hypothetical protein
MELERCQASSSRGAHLFAIQKKGREDEFFLELGFEEGGFPLELQSHEFCLPEISKKIGGAIVFWRAIVA